MAAWPSAVDAQEKTRRLIDLFVVSVLLDAGAGNKWQYKSKESGRVYRRSEGLAVASLEMYKMGLFSSDPEQPCQVDGSALRKLTTEKVAKGLQVTEDNPVDGLEGRTNLLIRLGDALRNQEIFGSEARPGNMLDYLLGHPTTHVAAVPIIPLPTLWDTLMDGFSPIWPNTRTQIDGVPLGDAWPCASMPSHPTQPWENIVPFHKLTQWLTYSLMVPMQKLANVHFVGVELMTGLPEYRNGGLLVDTGLLTLRPEDARRGLEQYQMNATRQGQPNVEVVPLFTADDDVIVEWRALTVGFLDMLLDEVNTLLGLRDSKKLSLAQMLEAGTWKVSPTAHCHHTSYPLTTSTGWQRDRRSLAPHHQRASHHDPLRRHRVLGVRAARRMGVIPTPRTQSDSREDLDPPLQHRTTGRRPRLRSQGEPAHDGIDEIAICCSTERRSSSARASHEEG